MENETQLTLEDTLEFADAQHRWYKTSIEWDSLIGDKEQVEVVNGFIAKDKDVYVELLNLRETDEIGCPRGDYYVRLEVWTPSHKILGDSIVLGSFDYDYVNEKGDKRIKGLYDALDDDLYTGIPGARSGEVNGVFPPAKIWEKEKRKRQKATTHVAKKGHKVIAYVRKKIRSSSK